MTFPVTDASNNTQQLLTGAELSDRFASVVTAVATLNPLLDGVETLLTNVIAAVNSPSGTQPLPTGAATQATLASLLAKTIAAPATEAKQDAQVTSLAAVKAAVDALVPNLDGLEALLTTAAAVGTETYALASNIGLAAGVGTAPVTVARGGYFFFDAAFTGSSPSLKLQRRGADGSSWIDVVTRAAVGSGDPVGVPNGAMLRVYNAGAGALTGVSAVLG